MRGVKGSWSEYLSVHLHARLAPELSAGEVGVVGGVDIVVGQGLVHILHMTHSNHSLSSRLGISTIYNSAATEKLHII